MTLNNNPKKIFRYSQFHTKLGPVITVGDGDGIYLLEFVDKPGRLASFKADLIPGRTDAIDSIESELKSYFDGLLTEFKTPLHILGTPFQQQVWEELLRIPYGHTRTYASQSQGIGKPKAYRAVANANGANQIAIVIPCHRVVNSNGGLGGYRGGIDRKQWLIDHETRYV
jgi:AraC family transcriptional regulator of adaptative response/methylated-DNA-[protein]-cysteine methyltransferase